MDLFRVKVLQTGQSSLLKKSDLLDTFKEELSPFMLSIPDIHTITIKKPAYGTVIITRE